mgnify:CR=1 FL=1
MWSKKRRRTHQRQSSFSLQAEPMVDQAVRRGFGQIEYMVEAIQTAIVGIGDLFLVAKTGIVEKQSQLVLQAWRTGLPEQMQVVAIHRQDQVEAHEIRRSDLPRTQA